MGPHQSEGEVFSFGTAPPAQAWACLGAGAHLTVVFLTFSVLVQGEGGTSAIWSSPMIKRHIRRESRRLAL